MQYVVHRNMLNDIVPTILSIIGGDIHYDFGGNIEGEPRYILKMK